MEKENLLGINLMNLQSVQGLFLKFLQLLYISTTRKKSVNMYNCVGLQLTLNHFDSDRLYCLCPTEVTLSSKCELSLSRMLLSGVARRHFK